MTDHASGDVAEWSDYEGQHYRNARPVLNPVDEWAPGALDHERVAVHRRAALATLANEQAQEAITWLAGERVKRQVRSLTTDLHFLRIQVARAEGGAEFDRLAGREVDLVSA